MLPQAEGTTSNRAASGKSNNSNRLKVEDLSMDPRSAKIQMVKADLEGRFGAQVIVKLSVNGMTKFWYLNIKTNPNYQLLVAKFGHDENDWAGEQILLGLVQDGFYDQYLIRVSFPAKSAKKT